jgi:hypothetical protein
MVIEVKNNYCPGGFLKFVEMCSFLTICYFSMLLYILVAIEVEKIISTIFLRNA